MPGHATCSAVVNTPVMSPSVNESVQPALQASLQRQRFCLHAGNAEFLANDIRCKKGLDGLGCLGEPAAWPSCPHGGTKHLGGYPSRELHCLSLAGGLSPGRQMLQSGTWHMPVHCWRAASSTQAPVSACRRHGLVLHPGIIVGLRLRQAAVSERSRR